MKALILASIVTASALLSPAQAVDAAPSAPAQSVCQWDAFRQFDMAGVFVSAESQMRVEIYPCGGSSVVWENAYGTHYAIYYSDIRVSSGGVAAVLVQNGLIGLDNVNRIGFKPAEPGFIQVVTMSPYGTVAGIYRLRKISTLT